MELVNRITEKRVNMIDLMKFDRLDRLRILLGTRWCACGCGLLDRTPYSVLAQQTGLPNATLNKMTTDARLYFNTFKLQQLARVTGWSANDLCRVLHIQESP